MLYFYAWPTPNGFKVAIALEEMGLPYKIIPVNINVGNQFNPDFLVISPNNKIPALVDQEAHCSLFESGAILIYLMKKSALFLPKNSQEEWDNLVWLFWQMSGLGPMSGQNAHFQLYSPEKQPYSENRYRREMARLYAVLNQRLSQREYVVNEYGIADMAIYPWIVCHEKLDQPLTDFPHLSDWFIRVGARPKVKLAYEKLQAIEIDQIPFSDQEAWQRLFAQDASVVLG